MLIWLLALAARGAAGASSCSANGALVAGACRCKDGWRGPDCGALDLVDGGRPLWPPASRFGAASSWGASVVAHDGAHWIFVSEMAAGCGLATWRSNSMVVAARSGDGPLGPYAAAEVLVPPFGHNAARAPASFVPARARLTPTADDDPGTAKSPWILLHIGGYRVEAKRTCGGGVTTPERRRLAGRARGAGRATRRRDGRTREDLGGHAWSDDGGATWTLSETNAYGNNFTTFDGARHTFKRPQRPQLHVAADGTPLALVLGVAGDSVAGPGSCRPPSSSPGCDRSWTLGVPTSALAGRRAEADDEADAPRAAPLDPAAPEPRRKTSFEERHDW
ncbi:hypothetical protein JL722_8629 [Aureococcus anophagefferens]|nr:hypothetical protein JL722_8629 [Aureococcus anophagefferens]